MFLPLFSHISLPLSVVNASSPLIFVISVKSETSLMLSFPFTLRTSLTVVLVTVPSAFISTYTVSFLSVSFASPNLPVSNASTFASLFVSFTVPNVLSVLSVVFVVPQPLKPHTTIDATNVKLIPF